MNKDSNKKSEPASAAKPSGKDNNQSAQKSQTGPKSAK